MSDYRITFVLPNQGLTGGGVREMVEQMFPNAVQVEVEDVESVEGESTEGSD